MVMILTVVVTMGVAVTMIMTRTIMSVVMVAIMVMVMIPVVVVVMVLSVVVRSFVPLPRIMVMVSFQMDVKLHTFNIGVVLAGGVQVIAAEPKFLQLPLQVRKLQAQIQHGA